MNLFGKEPAIWLNALAEVVRAVIPMLIIFGLLQWTDQQIAAVMLVVGVSVGALSTILTRQSSISVGQSDALINTATHQPPNTSPEKVKDIQAVKDAGGETHQ